MSQSARVILVTGANKGIGYEAVRLLSEQNPSDTILLGSRDVSAGEKAIQKMKSTAAAPSSYDNIKVIELDVNNTKSIQAAVARVKNDFSKLDILINNSGISNLNGDGKSPVIFDVNIYGVKNTTESFLPLIPSNGIIIVVSSTVGSWTMNRLSSELQAKLEDIPHLNWNELDSLIQDRLTELKGEKSKYSWPDVFGLYGPSKTFVSAYTRILARDHPELRICTVCPGYCATDLNAFSGTRPASNGGESVIWPISNKFENGAFYQDGKDMSYNIAAPPMVDQHQKELDEKMKKQAGK